MTHDLFTAEFDGSNYEPEHDKKRLQGQIKRIYELMKDHRWRTLREISDITKDGESSISAQLRHLRKAKFGSHNVEKRSRGNRGTGLWEYRIDGEKENKAGKTTFSPSIIDSPKIDEF